ncbi:hypothetical protein EJ08DRAFT_589391 [Tothia fuscella]|uniref:GST N-terminal domain-containing protein n=1 Tax=Tothia fuscella TaxID=1048955 RepID=A0A9P4TYT7_9PEZI|nr:hypothetical protein EJ08DRAFT_589391 [Tothia fuscella]
MAPVTLYDIPSRDEQGCWSYNPWKTRLVFNYKGIDYDTEWLEYPDIASTLRSKGIPPSDENPGYHVPPIRIENRYIMDSEEIAAALEDYAPDPSLRLDAEVLSQIEALIPEIRAALLPEWMPRIQQNVLASKSKDCFERTRSEKLGMPLDQLQKEKGGEQYWQAVQPVLIELASLVNQTDGLFFLGGEENISCEMLLITIPLSYADFLLVSMFYFMGRADPKLLDRLLGYDAALKAPYDACGKYFERSNW